jgi:hypothetical protein
LSWPILAAMLCRVRVPIGLSRRVVRTKAAVLALAVLTLCGCNNGNPGSAEGVPGQQISTAPAPDMSQRDAPLKVSVTKVSGTLSKAARAQLKAAASQPVREWLAAGFLRGTYPRTDFSSTYRVFTAGAARSATGDRSLLTNVRLGPRLVDVAAKRRSAQLSVLAIHGHPRGVSARVQLILLGVRRDGSRVTVRVSGDVYLTRAPGGNWKIFGYDLTREAGSR